MFSIMPILDMHQDYLTYFGVSSVIIVMLLGYLVLYDKISKNKGTFLFSLIPVFLLLVLVLSNNSIYLKSDKDIEAEDLDNAYSELIKPIVKDYTKDTRPNISVVVSELSQYKKKEKKGGWNGLNSVSDISYLFVKYPKINNESRTNEIYTVSDGKLQKRSEFKASDIVDKSLTEKEFLDKSYFNTINMGGITFSYICYYALIIFYLIIVVVSYKSMFKRGKNSKKGSVKKL